MARQGIFTGFTPNDGLGDSLALGATKVNQNFTEIYTTFGDGTNLSANAGSAGTWTKAGNSGIYTSKNVGIGTTSPGTTLDVAGTLASSGITQLGTSGSNVLLTSASAGNVGIGSSSPSEKLQINNGRLRFLESGQRQYNIGIVSGTSDFAITDATFSSERMRITGIGRVGINAAAPRCTLEIGDDDTWAVPYSRADNWLMSSWYYFHNIGDNPHHMGGLGSAVYWASGNSALSGSNNWNQSLLTNEAWRFSLLTTKNIVCLGNYIVLASDKRIKENIIEVPDDLALKKLRDISCCYYEYKDKKERSDARTIGFIAQQVKEHLPMAISYVKNIIPNEMRVLKNPQWSTLTDASGNTIYKLTIPDLEDTSGNTKYRFYVTNDLSGVEIRKIEIFSLEDDANGFIFDQSWNNVFCYGKEVDDFHTLDKNKLYTINFSATQEIDKIQQAEKTKLLEQTSKLLEQTSKLDSAETEITTLKDKVTSLETTIADLVSRLTALETA